MFGGKEPRRPTWLDRVERRVPPAAGQPMRSSQRSQLDALGQLFSGCLPSDLCPQTLPQPGAQLLDVSHP